MNVAAPHARGGTGTWLLRWGADQAGGSAPRFKGLSMTSDTTSTGMPPIAAAHDALDSPPVQAAATSTVPAVQSLIDEGKSQISTTIHGLADTVRDIATKLDDNGATPIARYVHDAADTVASWGHAVDDKSVDDLIGDTKTLVRTSPALAIGLAVVAGFAISRVVRSGR